QVLLQRYAHNPVLTPADVPPSRDGYEVIGVFNAGAVRAGDEFILLLRVAERPVQDDPGRIRIPLWDTAAGPPVAGELVLSLDDPGLDASEDRKSTRLNSSHVKISYAVFCLKKKKNTTRYRRCDAT